jgi:hypothetical protein
MSSFKDAFPIPILNGSFLHLNKKEVRDNGCASMTSLNLPRNGKTKCTLVEEPIGVRKIMKTHRILNMDHAAISGASPQGNHGKRLWAMQSAYRELENSRTLAMNLS